MDWRKQTFDELLSGCSCINDEVSCSTPAKLAKLPCPINDLADEDLAAIFKRLPPYERLIVSEVCRRWRDISRKSWLDVKTLDLSAIPGKHLGAVIKQCPNLQHVFAIDKWFGLNQLAGLPKIPTLSHARFYDCHFKVDEFSSEAFSAIFSDRLRETTWTELIMHDVTFSVHKKNGSDDLDERKCEDDDVDQSDLEYYPDDADEYDSDEDEDKTDLAFNAESLPATLTRFQLSGLRCFESLSLNPHSFLHGLERLENLECLILHDTPNPYGISFGFGSGDLIGQALDESPVFKQISRLKNLKELCLGSVPIFSDDRLSESLADLPKLTVLFLNDIYGDAFADDMKVLATKSTLRILVLSGSFEVRQPITLRARKRLDGEENLPPLHIFIDKYAEENIRFVNEPASNPAIITHSIDVPMPEFLEREDIQPIFDGVWVAEKIKETELWNYGEDFSDVSFDSLSE